MKKSLMFCFLIALMLAGCDLFPSMTVEDIQGEWDFPSVTFNDSSTGPVHLSVLEPDGDLIGIDLMWNDGANFYYGDGTMDGNTYTGTYDVGGDSVEDNYAITVKFSLSGDMLKAAFSGEGPLNGLVLEGGEPTPSS